MQTVFSRSLFDAINEGVLIIDPSGKILTCNQSFYKIHGLSEIFAKEYTIFDTQQSFHLHDMEGSEIPFKNWPFFQALNGKFLKNQVYKVTNLNKGVSFYGMFNTSMINFGEMAEQCIMVSITDINSYIEAKQVIEEKEKLLSAIINNSQDGIHVLNLQKGHYEFMSPAQSRLTGYPINELMFNVEEVSLRLHPEDIERVNQYLEKVISKEPPEKPVEYRWRTRSGEYRWFSDNRRAIFEDGKPVKLVGISRDITEAKHYEEELKNLNDLLTNMLYMAAHDIKSPIVNMKIMLQMLQGEGEDINFYLPKLNSSIDQLENVIEGLSKLIHAQVNNDVKVDNINLKEEVNAVLTYNQAKLKECKGKLLNQIEDGFTFNYIHQYINSILSNLVSNAIKYRNPRKELKILVSAERYKQQVKLMIGDNGIGMDLKLIGDKLFKPFSRFTSKVKGTGIGLYLINNLVRKNGGHMEVESEPGKGTTFICYLNEYPFNPTNEIYKDDNNDNLAKLKAQRAK